MEAYCLHGVEDDGYLFTQRNFLNSFWVKLLNGNCHAIELCQSQTSQIAYTQIHKKLINFVHGIIVK